MLSDEQRVEAVKEIWKLAWSSWLTPEEALREWERQAKERLEQCSTDTDPEK